MDRSELIEKNGTIREQIGKFFLDMAKLSFAGVVLAKMAYIRPEDSFMSVVTTITVGSLLTISYLVIGILILKLYVLLDMALFFGIWLIAAIGFIIWLLSKRGRRWPASL